MILVRLAAEADIPAMSEVLTRSITELCALDHKNDPAAVAAWTANKTPEGVRRILDNPDVQLFVAEHDSVVAAVGCVQAGNEIGLNYVHPEHRLQGVSRALLAAMEQAMREAGVTEAKLKATQTAHDFYRANGWLDAGELYTGRWIDAWPMMKVLRGSPTVAAGMEIAAEAAQVGHPVPSQGMKLSKGLVGMIRERQEFLHLRGDVEQVVDGVGDQRRTLEV
jgi:GNAT superfamily N-acetyltransferase